MNSLVIINENDLLEVIGGGKRKRKRRRRARKTVQKNEYYSIDDRDYTTITIDESSGMHVGGSLLIFNDNDGKNQGNIDSEALFAILSQMFGM